MTGTMMAGVASIHAIGAAYAELNDTSKRHGVKQVDRLLSNAKVPFAELMKLWAQFVIGPARREVVIALDWTDYDADDHSTLCAYTATNHGRATPLYWKTVRKSMLADQRTQIEHAFIEDLDDMLPGGLRVVLLADRGFGDQKFYELLAALGWDYVIRFRGNILVTTEDGTTLPAQDRVAPNGRAMMFKNARVTGDRAPVPAVVTVKAARMKEAWCLAASLQDRTAREVVELYGKRFTIEESFRDKKDLHFGLGLKATHIKSADRRDRLLLVLAMAVALITLLGAASEASGLDRTLKTNTVKTRTVSLFNQGMHWYRRMPGLRQDWATRLLTAYDTIIRQHAVFTEAFGVI
jgi:hypothetical protein